MRTVHLRPLAIAAAAVLSVGASVAAQDEPAAVLNSVEVRQLVARAEPADHVRLAAHCSALAGRYTADAKRHISMSQRFVGNPSRNLRAGMSLHCDRGVLPDPGEAVHERRERACRVGADLSQDAYRASCRASRPACWSRPKRRHGGHGCCRDAPWPGSCGAVMKTTPQPGPASAGPDVSIGLR